MHACMNIKVIHQIHSRNCVYTKFYWYLNGFKCNFILWSENEASCFMNELIPQDDNFGVKKSGSRNAPSVCFNFYVE